jgi:hypothetical protein
MQENCGIRREKDDVINEIAQHACGINGIGQDIMNEMQKECENDLKIKYKSIEMQKKYRDDLIIKYKLRLLSNEVAILNSLLNKFDKLNQIDNQMNCLNICLKNVLETTMSKTVFEKKN